MIEQKTTNPAMIIGDDKKADKRAARRARENGSHREGAENPYNNII